MKISFPPVFPLLIFTLACAISASESFPAVDSSDKNFQNIKTLEQAPENLDSPSEKISPEESTKNSENLEALAEKNQPANFQADTFSNEKTNSDDKTKSKKSIYSSIVDWYGNHLNYGTVTLLMTVESSFIPFPSEVIVPPAAYKALQPGSDLNIILIVVFATLGSLLGACINYFLAKILGRPIIYKFAASHLGRLCLLDEQKIEKAETYFRDHGVISTFIGRLVTVVRQLISIPAGLSNMNFWLFSLFTTLGALLWNIALAILGVVLHGQSELIEKYNSEISLGIAILALLFILYIFSQLFKKKKTKEPSDN